MKFGLTNRDMETIQNIFEKYPVINTVYVFGSRAKNTHKSGSDIDLAVMDGNLPIKTLLRLKNDFEESSLPYFVDIVNYADLKNPDLKQHILRVGQNIYSK
ncbi:hypothetical protein FACS189446_0920 [Bacteroidia bacterium]|nr:hypothetical protein FACS189446_0920 [Bacteroidia bacterium]